MNCIHGEAHTFWGNLARMRSWLQEWNTIVTNSDKCYNYHIFKSNYECEDYIQKLPFKYWRALCRFRTCNHKLPVERGRYSNIPRHRRFCNVCDSDVLGDEMHFILECTGLLELRKQYLPTWCHKNPNTLKFKNIMSHGDYMVLLNLAKYISKASQQLE